MYCINRTDWLVNVSNMLSMYGWKAVFGDGMVGIGITVRVCKNTVYGGSVGSGIMGILRHGCDGARVSGLEDGLNFSFALFGRCVGI